MGLNILLVVLSYFLGNISPAIIIARLVAKTDIRRHGSGNAGTTNVLRTLGAKAAAATLVIDMAKGVAAVLIGRYFGQSLTAGGAASTIGEAGGLAQGILTASAGVIGGADGPTAVLITSSFGSQDMAMACGLAALIGHIWPLIFRFKGGKGVATGLGVIMTVVPQIAWIPLVTALVLIALTRRVSVGAVIGVLTLPAAAFVYDKMYVSWAALIAVIIIVKHRQNIVRIIKGTEPKLSFGKK